MELLQSFVFDLGWVFFAAWGTTLTALAVVAFKPDIVAITGGSGAKADRH
jgi:hypothetical protein